MRHDVIIAARLAGVALGAAALAACSTMWAHSNEQAGSTSPAPAVTGQNSSATAPTPENQTPPPQTDVTEQKTGPK